MFISRKAQLLKKEEIYIYEENSLLRTKWHKLKIIDCFSIGFEKNP